MPRAPKPCGIKGCTVIVPNGQRCADHRHGWPTNTGATRTNTAEHRDWRTQVLQRAGHRCQIHYPDICIGTATIADHIKATALGGAHYDLDNGQAACAPCSNRKSSLEGHIAQGHNVSTDGHS